MICLCICVEGSHGGNRPATMVNSNKYYLLLRLYYLFVAHGQSPQTPFLLVELEKTSDFVKGLHLQQILNYLGLVNSANVIHRLGWLLLLSRWVNTTTHLVFAN